MPEDLSTAVEIARLRVLARETRAIAGRMFASARREILLRAAAHLDDVATDLASGEASSGAARRIDGNAAFEGETEED